MRDYVTGTVTINKQFFIGMVPVNNYLPLTNKLIAMFTH